MSPSHLSPSQGGSAAPAPTEEIWVLRKPFAGTVGTCCQLPVPRAARARTQRDAAVFPCPAVCSGP